MAQLNIANFKDKDSKKPEYRHLYETMPFIQAYARHTDMRIAKDGHQLAIGAKADGQQDWDKHGNMQLDFLIARGMKPEHRLLDFGCGTGRLAEKAIPYLSIAQYAGMDISGDAIKHCRRDYDDRMATFVHSADGRLAPPDLGRWDFIWSHSVITHLPPEIVEQLFLDLSYLDFGAYYFTFKAAQTNQRNGLKQFQYADSWLINTGAAVGLAISRDSMEWPAGQKTMKVVRA